MKTILGMTWGHVLDPQKLPPTERASYYHSLQVHCQVIIWIKLNLDALDPRLWGWTLQDNEYSLVQTDKDVAPENLLKFVRCKCKLTSKNPCEQILVLVVKIV